MVHKFASALGILAAPAAYAIGRLARNPGLSANSISFDCDYLRGYASKLQEKNISSEMFARFAQAAKLCASAERPIDAEMLELFPKSHGQLLQDIVCMLLHNGKRSGFFVEVGVGDGAKYSNSLMLERDFGWSGILAEPATMFHDSIVASRTGILDRRAVSDRTGEILVFEQDDDIGELSGLAGERSARGQQSLSTYDVETIRFDELLDTYNAPDEIHYISIDTEGSELAVLNGLSLDKRRVHFFTIEHNFDAVRKKKYDEILRGAGYVEILPHLSRFDAWYVHEDSVRGLFQTNQIKY